MIEQQGKVVKLEGTAAGVQIGPSTGCAACDAGKGCGAGIFAQLLRRKRVVVEVDNAINADLGEAVTVGIPEYVFLRLLFGLYLVPLLSGLVGAAVGLHFAGMIQAGELLMDAMILFGAVICVSVALKLTRSMEPRLSGQLNITLARLEKHPSDGAACHTSIANRALD